VSLVFAAFLAGFAVVHKKRRLFSNGFYTTLVLTAVITSQIAGAWLDYVLHKGWPLLSEFKASSPQPVEPKTTLTAA
jgi:hypothetical protein